MKPIRLSIQGFGPHSMTEIDFTEYESPLALVAPYGTGKTTMLEAIPLCLYGKGGWYSGSIYDQLTQGGSGHGIIEFRFEHGGKRYDARREVKDTGKTRTQKAELDELFPTHGQLIAGPKVQDFEREVSNLLGDFETFMGTVFLAQNKRGDLIGQPGEPDLIARRRAVFNELIGAGALDSLESQAAEEERRCKTIASEIEAQLAGEGDFFAAVEKAKQEHREALAMLPQARTGLNQAEKELEDTRKALRDAEGGDDVLKAQISEWETAKREKASIEERYTEIVHELDRLAPLAKTAEVLRDQLETLGGLKRKREYLKGFEAAYKARVEWEAKYRDVTQRIKAIHDRITALEQASGVTEETEALAAQAEDLKAKYNRLATENEEIEGTNAALARKREVVRAKIEGVRARIESLKARLATKPETPGGEICLTCPLLAEFKNLPTQIGDLESALGDHERDLEAIPPDAPLNDLKTAYEDAGTATVAAQRVREAEAITASIEAAKIERDEAMADRSALESHEPKMVNNPSDELQQVQDRIDRLEGVAERLKAAEEAGQKVPALKSKLNQLKADHQKAECLVSSLAVRALDARAALENREAQREELRKREQIAVVAHSEARQRMTDLEKAIARLEARIEEQTRRKAESEAKRKRLSELTDRIEGLKDLRSCFGPRGVRQILIDDAAPELEAIADELFEQATGGKMRLRIATQKLLQDGSRAEDFSIQITDERGERDATRYSGGQLQLILILFRISVAVWVGRLRGRRPDCLFLDEAFDRLGAEGTEDLMRVIDRLRESIGNIVVVTHDPGIAERMPGRIRLERNLSGVSLIHN